MHLWVYDDVPHTVHNGGVSNDRMDAQYSIPIAIVVW